MEVDVVVPYELEVGSWLSDSFSPHAPRRRGPRCGSVPRLAPLRPATSRTAPVGGHRIDHRSGSHRRAALRGALRRRHARRAPHGRYPSRHRRLRDDRGGRPPVPVALRRGSHRHRSRNAAQSRRRAHCRGGIDDHAAGGQAAPEQTRARTAPRLDRQGQRSDRCRPPGASVVEARDPRDVPQPRPVRQSDHRPRARQPHVLRRRLANAHAGPGGVSRRPAPAAHDVQSVSEAAARANRARGSSCRAWLRPVRSPGKRRNRRGTSA